MFLKNLSPISSELLMPLGGFYVQQGQLELLPVVLGALLGTVTDTDCSAQSSSVVFSARTPMRPGFFL